MVCQELPPDTRKVGGGNLTSVDDARGQMTYSIASLESVTTVGEGIPLGSRERSKEPPDPKVDFNAWREAVLNDVDEDARGRIV